jgi:hypothetical protein
MSAIEVGGHYLCAGALGFDPVRVWVGRIDPVEGLGDVASVTIKGDGAGLRSMPHLAFRMAELLASHPTPDDGFPRNAAAFDTDYAAWRDKLAAGTAEIMTISPSEAYGRAMDKISEGARHDQF